jgi:hypothetical protein
MVSTTGCINLHNLASVFGASGVITVSGSGRHDTKLDDEPPSRDYRYSIRVAILNDVTMVAAS